MNRRHFLRALGAATVGTLAHEQLSWLVRQPVSVQGVLEPVTIDMAAKTISVNRPMSLMEAFRYVADIMDRPENLLDPMPMVAVTPWHFRLDEGFTVTESGLQVLSAGSLQLGDGSIATALGGLPTTQDDWEKIWK